MKIARSFLLILSVISQLYPITEISFMELEDKNSLEKILKSCASYCEKLSNVNISFSCLERIEENIYQYRNLNKRPTKKTDVYAYDYKLAITKGKIEESRVLSMENSKKKTELQELIENKHIILEPVGLISDYWQKHHDYRIVKKTKLKGKGVIVIEAKPKSELEIGHVSGKIWVSEDDYSILKIELTQDNIGNIEKESVLKELKLKPKTTFTSEYQLYRKGIRFPTSYTVKGIFINKEEKKFTKFIMKVFYENYKFL